MFGLLGPGKSTLMRILATLQEPDEGTIRLEIDVVRRVVLSKGANEIALRSSFALGAFHSSL